MKISFFSEIDLIKAKTKLDPSEKVCSI